MRFPTSSYIGLFKSGPEFLEPDAYKHLNEQRNDFQAQLVPFLESFGNAIHNVDVRAGPAPERVLELLSQRSPFANTTHTEFLVVTADVDVDIDLLAKLNKRDDLGSFPEYCAAIEVSEAIDHALTLSELSAPGCISTIGGFSIANEGINPIEKKTAFATLLNADEDDPTWPQLATLDLARVLAWAQKVGYGKEAFAKSRLGRALAAFTHVIGLSQYREGEVLFRAMQGLEAFYCDGIGDLRRQLADKIRLWIGPWTDRRNVVGHLYDVRSAFVHGSAPIEYLNHRKDAWEENRELKDRTDHATAFAVRLLVRTLQGCIEKEVADITWGYRAETHG